MAEGKRVNVEKVETSSAAVLNGTPATRKRRSANRPKPKIGQHFLTDISIAERIVDALGDVSQTTVVEIGPGAGALTQTLATRARRLIAIELDRVLAAQLRMKYSATPNVEIIEGDVLAIDFATLFGPPPGRSRPGLPIIATKARVVGNLPYYITSPILMRLFQFHEQFETLVIMVQREVGDRIVAKPGGSEYGLLSATVQLYAKVEKLFVVPAGAFSPPPKVQSAVLRLSIAPQFERLGVPEQEFLDFLKLAFGQKRKTLVNNLKGRYEARSLTAALDKSRIKPAVRAEAVSLEKMAELFKAVAANS
ncbi:MAG TPA: 16S rRNA (adenine(1518)-N(6)/adenine(1519)-N(6))-dimethyltransferase RsmA [Terriglobales bacterium]|nr:16S rRNA (adenine(1518)-N(6)/adenine(1519)-N(6))-dimethyltransferase RsmA [Terriglobales bacterium]